MYKLTQYGVFKIADNMHIPNCLENKDWKEYLQWLEQGNTPQPEDDFSAMELKSKILAQITELDGKRSRAFFEPSEKEPGLMWFDYYNQQILSLREQYKGI